MTYEHRPVMLYEATGLLDAGPGAVYIDATVGGGGHAERLLEMAGPGGRVLGLDRDPDALAATAERLGKCGRRLTLVKARFSAIAEVAKEAGFVPASGVLFDLGVSSAQLDLEDRGFSYHGRSPLDMRMDPSEDVPTAADLLANLGEKELARVLLEYGEERWASRIASFVVQARRRRRLETAEDLVEVVKAAVPAASRRRGPHPARRVCQALRIAVNDELEELRKALEAVPDVLGPGGRVVVIAYHSLEDRVVKTWLRQEEKGCRCPPEAPVCRCGGVKRLKILTPKPLAPGDAEIEANPRSRSAKLRAAERLPNG